jgi:hypothetical protein
MRFHRPLVGCCCALLLFASFGFRLAFAEAIPAKFKQGSMHAFLLLKSKGEVIAVGDLVQIARGTMVHSRLFFRFRDGSIDDDRTVFLQRKMLQLVSDHHIQNGPSFPKPLDLLIDVPSGTTKSWGTVNGQRQAKEEHMEMPTDLADGLMPVVMVNMPPRMRETKVSYLVGSPELRLVKLSIQPEGQEHFLIAGMKRPAHRYKVHVEIGGIAGLIAPMIGKQPADLHIWLADGDMPAFIKMEGPLYEGGPIWTMEPTSPAWPAATR